MSFSWKWFSKGNEYSHFLPPTSLFPFFFLCVQSTSLQYLDVCPRTCERFAPGPFCDKRSVSEHVSRGLWFTRVFVVALKWRFICYAQLFLGKGALLRRPLLTKRRGWLEFREGMNLPRLLTSLLCAFPRLCGQRQRGRHRCLTTSQSWLHPDHSSCPF